MAVNSNKRVFSDFRAQPENESRPAKISRTNANVEVAPTRPFVSPAVVKKTGKEHPAWKTVLCNHFVTAAFCSFGDSCHYMHGMADWKGGLAKQKAANPKRANACGKTVLCQRFASLGSCEQGAACQFMHGNFDSTGATGVANAVPTPGVENVVPTAYKTVPCTNYNTTGYCSFGPMCQFAHGTVQSSNQNYQATMFQDWSNTGTSSYQGLPAVSGANAVFSPNSTVVQGGTQFLPATVQMQPSQIINPYPMWNNNTVQYSLSNLIESNTVGVANNQIPQKPFNYKTVLCRHFARTGCCLRGQTCQFRHNEAEVGPNSNYKTVPCRNWTKNGTCPYERVCLFKHTGVE